jgi:hypothetical protein
MQHESLGERVWKAEGILTEPGESIGYVQRRTRVNLGLAMGTVKEQSSLPAHAIEADHYYWPA